MTEQFGGNSHNASWLQPIILTVAPRLPPPSRVWSHFTPPFSFQLHLVPSCHVFPPKSSLSPCSVTSRLLLFVHLSFTQSSLPPLPKKPPLCLINTSVTYLVALNFLKQTFQQLLLTPSRSDPPRRSSFLFGDAKSAARRVQVKQYFLSRGRKECISTPTYPQKTSTL